ncbi:Response regulator receiver modulated diguanylate cyclase/phosphodiesterase with PAS/PAC sensor(S) [Pseudodesulfovibrio profundus]|uniref:Response regulator receiver modulated diguanylate cyclase/phosphodiesterase with PAS/PAC sensor(S) n=1 Tax=Pseudodesulfovibrio profundus TaxID=57320 RepID=A0A2C8F5L9_9BACT|nr:EAL domain-containing protein [Pseudodesulfovibrio profundus]SOB57682.1 Response regulator receiver modulated diguanylate cyclase/phosphodiesterase with PAS/PAC sensor(S) [Pseudodesulfovibrio profundus]|tara:strand:- start:3805 stop:5940 length:2136 start_codon:yes stop_codon:yes gene_type:complete
MTERVDILAVDDERINLKLIEGILRGSDLNVVMASSGSEALERAREYDFAVALLDVMMPGMDGFELADKLRSTENNKHLPIIFITAISKEQSHVFRGYELGAVDYLFKPVEPAVLRGKVGTFAELHRNKRTLEETTKRLESTINALESSQAALIDSEQRYRMVADYNYDWESWIDPEGNPVYVSPSCQRISGYPPDVFLSDPNFFERIVHGDDLFIWHNYMNDGSSGDDSGIDFRINRKDARVRWVSMIKHSISESGRPLGVRTSIRDVTNRKRMEELLKHSSLHDPLTGLSNRALFLDRVGRAIERSKGQGKVFGVLFINLNRFHAINDHYGHSMGDKLLVNVGVRLKQVVGSSNTVARFGGDEFVILFEDCERKDQIRDMMREVRASFEEPFSIDGVEFPISASYGLDTARNGGADREQLVHNAKLAMYKAKNTGKNRCLIYNKKMREGIINVVAVETDLKRGLNNGEFEAHFQPIVNLSDGSLYGFEALARWNHPERGMVSPGEFIPIAEETGLIVELGEQILDQSCSTMNEWHKQYPEYDHLNIAVNISAKQFVEASLIPKVESILKETGLPPNQLKLEITETVVMTDVVESTNRLNLLKGLGVLLSIDDFGTGYSSMSYLQKFPMDQLKIDLSFVRRMEESTENIEIVRAIINMAHSLRLRVVAEGIETERQRDLLYSLQCDYGQGYLYSKPLPKESAVELLQSMS